MHKEQLYFKQGLCYFLCLFSFFYGIKSSFHTFVVIGENVSEIYRVAALTWVRQTHSCLPGTLTLTDVSMLEKNSADKRFAKIRFLRMSIYIGAHPVQTQTWPRPMNAPFICGSSVVTRGAESILGKPKLC